jgi:UDP-glucuronate 4-epimerase
LQTENHYLEENNMKILVTGTAGFIGFHLAKRYCEQGDEVIGIDNLNDYYDVSLKEARLKELEPYENFRFIKLDLADREGMEALFCNEVFDLVLHMGAQAGVRYSIENPHAYIQSNIVGFLNILEGCRKQWGTAVSDQLSVISDQKKLTDSTGIILSEAKDPIENTTDHKSQITDHHLVYASSSSVYGINTKMPFSVSDNVDHPISLYAATKKANELMAHTYSHLYGLPTTGLRFFTVYGPWGRPDMALFKFVKAISEGQPIDVYNDGKMERDFTYIDDIVEGIVRVAQKIPTLGSREQGIGNSTDDADPRSLIPNPSISPTAPYKIYNIGNNNPVKLMDFIHAIESSLDRKAKVNMLPMQPGDVPITYADVSDLMNDIGFSPSTSIKDGIGKFVEWYLSYFREQGTGNRD